MKINTQSTWFRLGIVCMAAQLALAPVQLAHASIDSELTSFFNDIGGTANVTNGSAFEGQTQNVVSGGSLYARLPRRSYNLVNVQMPDIKAGCGGIDLFAGSFSFINAENFIAMVRNIGNNALGYAFELAIEAVDPQIMNTLARLRKTMEAINSMSINSCEAAQSLVNGMVGKIDNAAQKGCSSLSAYLNLSSDRVEGIGKCSDPIERKNTADAVRADPDLKSKTPLNIVSGNLMARVLDKAYPWMSASEKKLLISMTGTLIINNIDPTDASKATLFHVEASITDAKDIVAGIQGSATSDKVIVPILDCIDPDSVVCDKAVPTEIVSLKHMVDLRMTEYQQRMAQGDTNWAADQKSEMMNFVNIATVPVLRMLKTEVAHEIGMRHNFIELIATQYAIYWLSNMVRLASNAVSSYPSLGPEEADQMEKIHANLVSLKAKLDAQHNEAAKAAASLAQLAEQLERFDKTLRMNDTDLAKAVQLSRSLSAGGSGAAGFYGAH